MSHKPLKMVRASVLAAVRFGAGYPIGKEEQEKLRTLDMFVTPLGRRPSTRTTPIDRARSLRTRFGGT